MISMGFINHSKWYNEISQVYDISRTANAETVEKLVKLLSIDKNSSIVDLGCGTGNYSIAISKTSKNIVGIDKSIGMIRQALAKSPTIQFINGSIMYLPFNSETFDSAIAIQVLHHTSNKEQFLRETYRVLRKGSHIALQSCSHEQLQAFWFCHYFKNGLKKELEHTLDINEIVSLLENIGFSNIGIELCYTDIVVSKEQPKSYLEKNYRNGISTFSLMTEDEINSGCEMLRQDIASGKVEDIIQQQKAKVAKIGGTTIIYGQKV